jgi:hypothetical protein
MRRNLVKLVLTCLLLLSGVAISKAANQPILDVSHPWRFLITNAMPQGGWTNVNYPAEEGWSFNGGVFAFPADEPMPPSFFVQSFLFTNFNGNIVTSFYFRTSINLTSALPTNVVVQGSAVIDDGAVIYVNGREVTRIRMPAGNITHNTFANAGGEVGARVDFFQLSGTNFVRGTNVIAAWVHQDAAASSDVVFGLRLTPVRIDPVTITAQPYPVEQTIDTGSRATFLVGALGSEVTYQWYSNNVPINGARSYRFQTPILNSPNTGIVYHVVVSNALNSIRSSNVVLTVVTDVNGPVITNLALTAQGGVSNRLRMDFNEPLLLSTVYPAITNKENYSVTLFETGEQLGISNILAAAGNVTLLMSNRMNLTNRYMVCAYNIPDSKSNFTASTCETFRSLVFSNVFTLGSEWRFYNLGNFLGDITEENWTSPGYDDSANASWGEGVGLLGFDPSEFPPPNVCYVRTTDTGKGPRTFYYRKRVTFPTAASLPTNNPTIFVRHAIDDGAVFYINGQELTRVGMPAAPTAINYSTVATRTVVDALCETFAMEIPRGWFRVGSSNFIAVEVHQSEGNPTTEAESDNSFDMELSFQHDISFIPQLTITRVAGTGTPSVIVRWNGATEMELERAPTIDGPWTEIPANAGANAYRTATTNQYFFRSRSRN